MKRSTPFQSPAPKGFSWQAALFGGLVAIGGSAFLGTFIANVSLWYSMWLGLSFEQAYANLDSGITSPTEVLSFVGKVASGLYGGYVSAKYGSGHPLAQSVVAGSVSVVFPIVMLFSPLSQPGSIFSVALSLFTPVVSSLFGGYTYLKLR